MIKRFENFDVEKIKSHTINKNIEYDTPDMSYVGKYEIFFDKEDIHSKKELIDLKDKISVFLSNREKYDSLNKVQLKFILNKLNLIYLYIDYHEFFEKKYGKESYRYIGYGVDEDLEEERTRIKSSKMSIIESSWDGGFVDFWSFGDSVVFRTIKKLRVND